MQLNCKVIKKRQPPISTSTPPFQGYPPFLANFLVPPHPQVTQFLKVLPPPSPLIMGGGGGVPTMSGQYSARILVHA